ncbi:cell wall-binding repeat-containing protein [Ornithinimicrobium tianjinense]|uniref:Cell wall binding repeat 2 n=1 Tax=Ornithinimicrobium tianjinense TaxID=1195761 RepID=A0A917BV08_9MICO|nr:cell wall-binding repeat-containing protein [Ornithinimicrobium tianjinense]GGF57303.1 hypothetical protein GCM10011366_26460 [Ornithinimicrobium tianjinense]
MKCNPTILPAALALCLAGLPAVAAGADQPGPPLDREEALAPVSAHEQGPSLDRTGDLVATNEVAQQAAADTRPEAAAAAAAYLDTNVDGVLHGSPDMTAQVALALVAVGGHDAKVAQLLDAIEAQVGAEGITPVQAASVSLLVTATGGDPWAFGGVDLVELVRADLADNGRCDQNGGYLSQVTNAAECALALTRAGVVVPQVALDTLAPQADPVTGGLLEWDGLLYAYPNASALDALTALDALDAVAGTRRHGLGARDFLWGYGEVDGPFDSTQAIVVNARVVQALAVVGEDVSAALSWLEAQQLPDGSLPDVAGSATPDLMATAHAAIAFSGRSLGTVGPGAHVVAYGSHPYVVRTTGADRYEVAANLATAWVDGSQTVVIASGQSFADAIPGSALAAHFGAPILLARQGSLPATTRAMLRELQPTDIVVMGGEAAVGPEVFNALHNYVVGGDVHRVDGANRYEVSANASYQWDPGTARQVYLATGENWPDGLTGGAEAGRLDVPMFLTKKDAVPSAVLRAMKDLGVTDVVVLGGTSAISTAVEWQLQNNGFATGRISGVNRYDVAAKVARGDAQPGPYAFVASGLNWPDALATGPLAAALASPLVLVKGDAVPGVTAQRIVTEKAALVSVSGGPVAVSGPVAGDLRLLTTYSPFEP